MKRFFIAIAAGLLLMFSCTGNRAGQGGEMPNDSVADSTDTMETDTMELLITQTPMPRAADAMFDDFLFNFLANKRLQKERIVFPLRIFEGDKVEQMEERQWQMEHLFMRQGYYTLLFNDEQQMALMKDTAVSEAVVEKILLKKNQVKDYMFRRIRGAWMLCEVRVNPLEENINASFLKFYQRFSSDSTFQVKSLNETVQFVGPDPPQTSQELLQPVHIIAIGATLYMQGTTIEVHRKVLIIGEEDLSAFAIIPHLTIANDLLPLIQTE